MITKNNTVQEARIKIRDRKSKVRVYITYGAGLFLFLGGFTLIISVFIFSGADFNFAFAKDIFYFISNPSVAAISYWFAKRESEVLKEK